MAARAWRESAKAVGVDSGERVFVALLGQAVISAGIFFWVTDPSSALLTRVLTAAAPFLLFPVLFAWKWISLPPQLAKEARDFTDACAWTLHQYFEVHRLADMERAPTLTAGVGVMIKLINRADAPLAYEVEEAWAELNGTRKEITNKLTSVIPKGADPMILQIPPFVGAETAQTGEVRIGLRVIYGPAGRTPSRRLMHIVKGAYSFASIGSRELFLQQESKEEEVLN
jgi:hypothetical protein